MHLQLLVLGVLASCASIDLESDTGIPDLPVDTIDDTGLDLTPDVPVDSPVDTPADTLPDTPADMVPDTFYDTGYDTGLDTLPDIIEDTMLDTLTDTVTDTGFDTGVDTVTDTGIDTGVDTITDTGIDTGVDTITDTGVDTAVDTITDTGTDPVTTWGVPICGTGATISDMGSYTDSVTVPALGNVLVMQLDIVIDDRSVFVEMPFSDLVVGLESPYSGNHQFWTEFLSDDTGSFFPDYSFPAVWEFPQYWDTPVGGTWTLTIDDTELTLSSTTLVSWCITPLDPALHVAHPITATTTVCATDTGSIPDCDLAEPDCPGDAYFEMQISDIVHDYGTPTLDLNISHSRHQDLAVYITLPNGAQQTLWDRSVGTIPTSFSLTGLTDEWITGRYQIHVEDHDEINTGSVTSWCVNAN